jgi:hypothetical protein
MDRSVADTTENAIEAWKSHLALSSGSERSYTASSRGSSSMDAGSLYRRQQFEKQETTTDKNSEEEHLARESSEEESGDDDGDEEMEADDDDDDDDEDEDDSGSEAESHEGEESLRDADEPAQQEADQDSEPTPTDVSPATVDIFSTAFCPSESLTASPAPEGGSISQAEAMVQLLHLQHQDEHLHSPQPQRNYRATVTSAYEPTPLPLYDHSQLLLPTHMSAPYIPRFPQVGAPWQPHAIVPHAAHGAYAARAPMMYPVAHAGFPYSEAPEPTTATPRDAPLPETIPSETMPSHSKQRRKLAGYELIASRLSQPADNGDAAAVKHDATTCKGPLPLYRRFEELNHRILLHLQEEISALETDLHAVDDEIIEMSAVVSSAARAFPYGPSASKSGDSPLVEELKYRRTELLGRVFIKLGQYSEPLPLSRVLFTLHVCPVPYLHHRGLYCG